MRIIARKERNMSNQELPLISDENDITPEDFPETFGELSGHEKRECVND
jgi:hypothetical protein